MYDFNNGGYFDFRGVNSIKYNLKLLNLFTSASEYNSIFGIKRSVEELDAGVSYENQFISIKSNKQEFSFEVVKSTPNYKADKFTEKELNEIKRWLFPDDKYYPLKINGYTYYVVFVNGEQSFTQARGKGSIKLTVHTLDGLKHGNICIQDIENKYENSFRIESFYSNFTVGKECYATIIVTQKDKLNRDITIENLSNNSIVVVKGLKYGEQAKIISKTGEIFNIQEEDDNLFSRVVVGSDSFFTISYGINKIKLSGIAKAQISYVPNYVL